VNLGEVVNTTAAETRPSLSRNARTLLFGRTPGPEESGDGLRQHPRGAPVIR
jgi:hypothetical protein